MASRSLGSLTVDVIAKVGGFAKGMTAAERQAEKSSKVIQERMRRLGRGIDAGLRVAAAAAVAATAAITLGVGNAINRLDEIGKASQKVGLTTEALSKLAYAAKLADVDFQALQGGLVKLTKAQDAAAQGSAAQLDLFRALGVEFQNQDGTLRNTSDVLADLADKFQALPDGADKTAAAVALGGKRFAELIPLLNGGSEALREAGDELDRMGGTVTPEAAKQAEIFNDNLTRLKTASDGVFQSLAQSLLPTLVSYSEEAAKAAGNTENLSEISETADQFLRGLGLGAQLAIDGVQQLTSYVSGLYSALVGLSKLNVSAIFRGGPGADFEAAAAAFGKDNLAESRQNFFGGGAAPPSDLKGSSGSPNGRGRGVQVDIGPSVQENLARIRKQDEAGAAAKTASAAASRGLAEAERALADAERARADQKAEAYDEIQRVYQDELQDKQDLAEADKQAKEIVDQTLADIAFETKLLGLNAEAREELIALRYAGVKAASAEGEQIIKGLRDYEEAAKEAAGVDYARDAAKGVFEDLVDGVGSANDAIDNLFDNLRAKAVQLLADKLFDGLFDVFKTDATSGKGGIGGFLGSLFGGALASGGPVYPGKAYLVGEEGPELIRPMGAGVVSNARETARMGSGGGTTNVTFVLPGRNDLRTESQRQADMGRATQRQLSRSTA